MPAITIHEAKTQLSKLIQRAEIGEEVIIARGNRPVARLVPFVALQRPIVYGLAKGKIRVPANFDDPLPDDVLATFEGQ